MTTDTAYELPYGLMVCLLGGRAYVNLEGEDEPIPADAFLRTLRHARQFVTAPEALALIGELLTIAEGTPAAPTEGTVVKGGIPVRAISVNGAVGIECEHGYDCCPQCDQREPKASR